MRQTLVGVAVMLWSTVARAQDDSPATAEVVMVGLGVAAVTYGTVQTMMMIDDDLKKGYSGPEHTVPSAFLAAASLLGAGALTLTSWNSGNRLGIVGGGLGTVASAFMVMVVMVSVHGWAIRQGPQRD